MANGRIHHLNITDVSGGIVTGEYNRLPIEAGYWDGKMLTFYRGKPYCLFARNSRVTFYAICQPDYKWRIAGVFQAEPDEHQIGPGGWYATQPFETYDGLQEHKIKEKFHDCMGTVFQSLQESAFKIRSWVTKCGAGVPGRLNSA